MHLGVFVQAKSPCGLQGASEQVFLGKRQDDVCSPAAAPAALNRNENFGHLLDEGGLLFRCDHDIAVAEFCGGKRGENPTAYAEVGITHMGGFFRSFKA